MNNKFERELSEDDKIFIKECSVDRLQNMLAQLEFEKEKARHKKDEVRYNYFIKAIDAICGELIKRDLKIVNNSSEPRWNIPPCPDYYHLLALGDGSVEEPVIKNLL